MGWSFSCDTDFRKAEQVAKLKKPEHWSENIKVLDTCVVGNHVWQVLQRCDDAPEIFLTRIAGGGRQGLGWGYKHVGEEAKGFAACDCPLAFLARVPEPANPSIPGWREKVRAFHAAARKKATLKVGDHVRVYGRIYTLSRKRQRGWFGIDIVNGSEWRIVKDFTPVTPEEARAFFLADGEPLQEKAA